MHTRPIVGLVVALAVVGATVAPATAGGSLARSGQTADTGAGDRLQGAVGVQEAELEGELATREFGVAFEGADSNASKAGVVAEQVADLEARLAALSERKRAVQRARENGSLTDGEYRARTAVLAARIGTVQRLANRTDRAAGRLPAAALRERGVDRTAIRELGRNASELAGPEVTRTARSVAGPSTGRELAASNRPEAVGPPAERPGGEDRGNRSQPGNESQPENRTRSGNRSQASGSSGAAAPGDTLGGLLGAVGGAAGGLVEAAVGSVVGTASAQSDPDPADRPLLEVPVREDGSARVTLVLTFDLTGDDERRAFETLQEDDEARADVRSRFLSRMRSIANQSETVVDREMRVEDARIALSKTDDGETGVVEISVAWAGLAAVEDRHLVVTEPFASGFTPDREFRVRITAPDSYRVTTARPEPGDRGDGAVVWLAGADLDGFTLVFSPEDRTALPEEAVEELQPNGTVAPEQKNPGAPGFGPGVALAALAAGAAIAARRR